jgi:hypothetical protein
MLMKTCISVALLLATTLTAFAEVYPLTGPWISSSSGPGSAGCVSEEPTTVVVTTYPPFSGPFPPPTTTGYASLTNILTVTSNTVYTLKVRAQAQGMVAGLVNISSGSILGPSVTVLSSWTNYTVSFFTLGPNDTRVGQPLTASLQASAYTGGGGAVTYTNIVLEVAPVEARLQIGRFNATQYRVFWPANFSTYQLETTTNLQGTWVAVTNVPVQQADQLMRVTVDSKGESYFRLRKP